MLTKEQLRLQMRKMRGNKKAEDQKMVALLEQCALVRNASRIFAFVPLHSEVDITPILDAHPIALPRCGKDGSMEFHALEHNWRSQGKRMELGVWEPVGGFPVVPDAKTVMLVPALAFDREGYRLGRGGGYYDRYLARFPRLVTIGLGYSWHLVDQVPRKPHDRPVMHLLCGSWIR